MTRRAGSLPVICRFGAAGAVNTLVGLLIIAGLDLGLGVEPRIANASGYGVGFGLSFLLSRWFVFENTERIRATGPRFLVAVAVGFALNQTVLAVAAGALGFGIGARIAAQLLAATAYTVATFLLFRLWVFREARKVDVVAEARPPARWIRCIHAIETDGGGR